MTFECNYHKGLRGLFIPWLDSAEVISKNPLEKPTSFEHAQLIEKNCVAFAKDVRKANKMLAKIEELAKELVNNKTTAEQQIEEQVHQFVTSQPIQIFSQKVRFKSIASVAASRVESMRDLLIR